MDLDPEKLIENALRDGIREGIKQKLTGSYNNPLDKLIVAAVEKSAPAFQSLLVESIQVCVNDAEFRQAIRNAVRTSLAKALVHRFGGELEKQINVLKSDPATRARITLAIEAIMQERLASPA